MAAFDFVNNKCLIKPNVGQLKTLRRWAEARRFAYNKGVEGWSDSRFEVVGWLKSIPANVVRFARDDHKRYGGGFRSRFRDPDNFRLSSRDGKLERGWLAISGLGRLRLRGFRDLAGRVVAYQFREEAGRWFVTICRKIDLPKPVRPSSPRRVVGIDLGLTDLATLSTGQAIPNPFFFRQVVPQVAKLVDRIERGRRGSNRNSRLLRRLGRIFVAVRNRRNDFLHRLSTAIVKKYEGLGLETLDARRITESCRSNRDAAIGHLGFLLRSKAAQRGVAVHQVGRWFPSSKTCSACGQVYSPLQLSDRSWTCPKCDANHDRDVNAALNLRNQAVKALC